MIKKLANILTTSINLLPLFFLPLLQKAVFTHWPLLLMICVMVLYIMLISLIAIDMFDNKYK